MSSFAKRKQVHQTIAAQSEKNLARLRQFISQPSVSKENIGVAECAQLLYGYFQELGCQEVELVETPGLPAVWAYYDAGAPKTLAIYGYFDTNVVGSGWTHDPQAAVVAEHGPFPAVLYGRGAANKGGLLAFLDALSAIKEVEGNLPVNLMFVTEGEEFLGSVHIPWLIERYRSRLSEADALFSPKPSQAASGDVSLYLGNKGCLHMELACTGERWGRGPVGGAIHSSAQCVVDSPVWRLVSALNSMYDAERNHILIEGLYDDLRKPTPEELELIDILAEKYKGREAAAIPGMSNPDRIKAFIDDVEGRDIFLRYCYQPTMNINGLRAGYTGPGTLLWTLPTAAYSTIDIRLPSDLHPDDILAKIRKHLDERGYTDIEITVMEASMGDIPVGVQDVEIQAALQVFRAWGVEPTIWPRRGAGGPTGFFSAMLGLKQLNSPGMSYASGHSDANEFLVIKGNGKVGGLVELEQSLADVVYSYANYPQPLA